MKTKNRIVAFLCCAALLWTLAGCQLAREGNDNGANSSGDKLIGVFVSTEYIDLFDMDGYINDNANNLIGGEFIVDGSAQEYQDRLYATVKTETLTSDTGEKTESEDYVFENIPGFRLFAPTLQSEHGNYTATMSDDAFSDVSIDVNEDYDKNSRILEGTIYTVPEGVEVYYFNPVYQSEDGSVYLTSGEGISVSGVRDESDLTSHTLDATYTVTENGKSKTESISVSISYSVMFAPENIVVLQMDAEGSPLSRTEYAPGAMPEELTPGKTAAYLIVETHKKDAEGKPRLSREIYGDDAEIIETYSAREDGVCVKRETQIKWPG
jgi:hypothetical protein